MDEWMNKWIDDLPQLIMTGDLYLKQVSQPNMKSNFFPAANI